MSMTVRLDQDALERAEAGAELLAEQIAAEIELRTVRFARAMLARAASARQGPGPTANRGSRVTPGPPDRHR
jgi:hypothetical protein